MKRVLIYFSTVFFLVALSIFFWYTTKGYFHYVEKIGNADIVQISFHDKIKYREILMSDSALSEVDLRAFALEASILKKISSKAEIAKFVGMLHPVFFNLTLTNCKCQGEVEVVLFYSDRSRYNFGIAHNAILKMDDYVDLDLGSHYFQWAQLNLPEQSY